MKNKNLIISLLIITSVLDFLFTKMLINKFGINVEANPVLHYLISKFDVSIILLMKLAPIFVLLACDMHITNIGLISNRNKMLLNVVLPIVVFSQLLVTIYGGIGVLLVL